MILLNFGLGLKFKEIYLIFKGQWNGDKKTVHQILRAHFKMMVGLVVKRIF